MMDFINKSALQIALIVAMCGLVFGIVASAYAIDLNWGAALPLYICMVGCFMMVTGLVFKGPMDNIHLEVPEKPVK